MNEEQQNLQQLNDTGEGYIIGSCSKLHPYKFHISTAGPTKCTVCFQFIAINSLYMFPALLAHHQEVLYVQQLVYFVCIMSTGC
jgi:hypothetical protein